MDPITTIRIGLRHVFDIFPVEVALALGAIFFACSWIRPHRMVNLSSVGGRSVLIAWIGIAGSLAVLATGTATSWLATFDPLQNWGGWWQRPAPLLAAALVIAAAALAAAAFVSPATPQSPGERVISPPRRWWAFSSQPLLWTTSIVSGILALTAAWQILTGVSAPPGADRYGIVPPETDLPVYTQLHEGMGYFWGAGWPNHLVTLGLVVVLAVTLASALGRDARRPLFSGAGRAGVREERATTSRVLILVALGAVLLTLGAVWAHVGFAGSRSVSIDSDPAGGRVEVMIGSPYQSFAPLMHLGGYVIQGIGAALLLRLAVDTGRALRAVRRMYRPDRPDSPDCETSLAGSTRQQR